MCVSVGGVSFIGDKFNVKCMIGTAVKFIMFKFNDTLMDYIVHFLIKFEPGNDNIN